MRYFTNKCSFITCDFENVLGAEKLNFEVSILNQNFLR